MKIQPDSNHAEISSKVRRSMQKLEKQMKLEKDLFSEKAKERTKEILKRKLGFDLGRVKITSNRSVKEITDGNNEVALASKKIDAFAQKIAREQNLDGKGIIS